MSEHPLFGEMQGGVSDALHDRHRQMMVHTKALAKAGDDVLAELARVGGNDDVTHDGTVWDDVKDIHDSLRNDASDIRSELRSDGPSVGSWKHHDIRHQARAFANEMRGLAEHDWIERRSGDDQDFHPDDIDAMAGHAEHITGRLENLFNHIKSSTSGRPLGDEKMPPVGLPRHISVFDDLRDKARTVREEHEAGDE